VTLPDALLTQFVLLPIPTQSVFAPLIVLEVQIATNLVALLMLIALTWSMVIVLSALKLMLPAIVLANPDILEKNVTFQKSALLPTVEPTLDVTMKVFADVLQEEMEPTAITITPMETVSR